MGNQFRQVLSRRKAPYLDANVDGNQDIYLYDLATQQAHACHAKGINSLAGAETAFSHDGTGCSIPTMAPTLPTIFWAYDFARRSRTRSRIRWSAAFAAEDMVEPFLVHYPSKDGKWQISAFVYVPYNAEKRQERGDGVHPRRPRRRRRMNSFNRGIQYW